MKEVGVILEQECSYCGKKHSVRINKIKDYHDWQNGKLAQFAFPYLDATEREELISNLCPECQLKFFGGDEDED